MTSNLLRLAVRFWRLSPLFLTLGATAQDSTLHLSLSSQVEMIFSLLPSGSHPEQKDQLIQGLWVSQTELTVAQWNALMTKPLNYPADEPARGLSWSEFQGFIGELNGRFSKYQFRLPTEIEWEYAAGTGASTEWFFGSDAELLKQYAWTRENAFGQVKTVGLKLPNPWGLFDIYGNVWELCSDDYPTEPREKPLRLKVRKGGSAVYDAYSSRTAYTYSQPTARGNGNIGVRLVMTLKQPEPKED